MIRRLYDGFRTWQRNFNSSFGDDISTPKARRLAKLHVNIVDHAWIRRFWTNMYPLTGQVWRSNQPGPHRFHRLRRLGIKSIINLRGASVFAVYQFEAENCAVSGIRLYDNRISAYSLSDRESYLSLLTLFDQVEKPLLIHCKSGADRAGFASALYLIDQDGLTVDEARKQLSLKYGHRKRSKAGILGFMLEAYARDNSKHSIPIRNWLETRYDRDALKIEFNERRGKSRNK
ncbi:MAG: dual specificity protein phosphatase family protein [Rhodobacteraceae bacterium]|nr:dual specificity protein phosphatase family protein [Paracoccaceae bacterium]